MTADEVFGKSRLAGYVISQFLRIFCRLAFALLLEVQFFVIGRRCGHDDPMVKVRR